MPLVLDPFANEVRTFIDTKCTTLSIDKIKQGCAIDFVEIG